ncbi:RHS repeat-associated core domain-containing protein, partial [Pseudomonas viridiflava]|uniref:RHS repeat-associated core domain-containing protein n=2 Tax=Pseudomonas TaxID=286 RepID=UPI002ECF82DC|nr:RHS repeat-associated core domain-containing protein [Pseudomonas viridiflava]
NPLRFQGQYFDAETGLHYNRHRYYNPGTGRFLTPDPIKLAGGLNNYQYVPNPTGWVDPLGLNGCPDGNKTKSQVRSSDETAKATVNDGSPSAPSAEDTYLYRGDTRPHGEIFKEGFKSKGDSMDLELHAFDNNTPPSNFISTSTSSDVAIDFGTAYRTKSGNLYTLRRIDGRDVNSELGSKVPFPEEKEIAIPGQVNTEDILGVTPLKPDGSYVGYSIPNPARK